MHPAAEIDRTPLGYVTYCALCGVVRETRYHFQAAEARTAHDRALRDVTLASGTITPDSWATNRDGYRERTITVWRVFLQDPGDTGHPYVTLETVQYIETLHHDGITRGTAFNFSWDGDPHRIASYAQRSRPTVLTESARLINSRHW